MEKTMLNLPLPLPLYRGIVAVGTHAGKMIEGSVHFTYCDEHIYIAISTDWGSFTKIRPETLCMYIGKEDMNGKRIFTGAVLKIEIEDSVSNELVTEYFLVFFDRAKCSFRAHCSSCDYFCDFEETIYPEEVEVIGNIHENPELLKLFPHLPEGMS